MATVIRFGHVTYAAVTQFETLNSLILPSDYRTFLQETNGGHPTPNRCYVPGLQAHVTVDVLFGISLRERSLNLDAWLTEFRDELAPGIVVIGGDPGPNLFVLGTTGEFVGVYFWDHAHVFEVSSEGDGNTYFIAATFTDFLDSLHV